MLLAVRPAIVLLLTATLSCVGCGGKYDSPEACFQTLRMAAHHHDYGAMCDCLTPDSQESLAGALVMAGSMLRLNVGGLAPMLQSTPPSDGSAAPQPVEVVGPVMDKHGLSEAVVKDAVFNPANLFGGPSFEKLAALVQDKRAFIVDMYGALQNFSAGERMNDKFTRLLSGEIKQVTLAGDKATAVVATSDEDEQLEFRNTLDGWKLHLDVASNFAPGR